MPHFMTPSPPTVAILAGGRSRRMGCDKARLKLGSSTLIERVLAAVMPLEAHCLLIANDAEAFADLKLPIHADLRPNLGPLGGLYTALTLAPSSPLLLLACDLPFITSEFLHFLLQELGIHQALVPRSVDGLQPLCAVYTRSCLPPIERALDRRDLRMTSFYPEVDVRILPPHHWQHLDPHQLLLTNLNTPEEYWQAQEWVKKEEFERARTEGEPKSQSGKEDQSP